MCGRMNFVLVLWIPMRCNPITGDLKVAEFFIFILNWIGMGQYTSTQPCVTALRRSVCTTLVLGDKNGCNADNNGRNKVAELWSP